MEDVKTPEKSFEPYVCDEEPVTTDGKKKKKLTSKEKAVQSAINQQKKIAEREAANKERDAEESRVVAAKKSKKVQISGGEKVGLAVKVFKTSVLVFKDRARYTEGDYRLRHGCHKGNPRKVVEQWCEKEFRNLMRIKQKAKLVKTPLPIAHRQNVLVMTLIGDHADGCAAPRLKDVRFSNGTLDSIAEDGEESQKNEDAQLQWELLYYHCCDLIRDLFQSCGLVHGDLSEYNMLFDKNQVYIIDVSQSVEKDHPHALDFLKRDCGNINDFFRRQKVEVAPLQALYRFVIEEDDEKADLDALREEFADVSEETMKNEDEVFKNSWIPSNLHQISDLSMMDRDMDALEKGQDVRVSSLLAPNTETQGGSSASTRLAGAKMGKKDSTIKKEQSRSSEVKSTGSGRLGQKREHLSRECRLLEEGCGDESVELPESMRPAQKTEIKKKSFRKNAEERLLPLVEEECASSSSSDEAESDASESEDDDEEVDEEERARRKAERKALPKKTEPLAHGARDPNMSKADWKKLVKEERAEKRADKIPKKLKKKCAKKK